MFETRTLVRGESPLATVLLSDHAAKITRVATAVVFALFTLNFPIEYFTGIDLRWPALLVFLPIVGLQALAVQFSQDRISPTWVIFGLYLALLGLAAALSLRILPASTVVIGSLLYLVLPVTFFLAMQFDARNRVRLIASVNLWIALLAAIAGYYQLHFDKVIFGLYQGTSYQYLEYWGSPRAASLFYSPQVFSVYMVFSVMLHDCVFRSEKRFPGIVAVVITAFALLAGSLTVVAGIGGYYLVKLVWSWAGFIFLRLDAKGGTSLGGLAVAVLAVAAIHMAVTPNPAIQLGTNTLPVAEQNSAGGKSAVKPRGTLQSTPFERVVSAATGKGRAADANTSRIEIWKATIRDTPVLGNGIGSASTLIDGKNRRGTEAYVLSLYYQGGWILVAAFVVLFGGVFLRRKSAERLGFAAVLAGVALISQAYDAWALAVVWVMLFGLIELDDFKATGSPRETVNR